MPVFEWEQVEHGTRLTCHVTIVRDEPDPLPGLYQEIIDELRSRYQDWVIMLEENMPDQSTEDEEAGGQVNENEEGENEDERSNDDDDDDCSSDNTLVSIESGDEEIDFSFAISGFIQMSDASTNLGEESEEEDDNDDDDDNDDETDESSTDSAIGSLNFDELDLEESNVDMIEDRIWVTIFPIYLDQQDDDTDNDDKVSVAELANESYVQDSENESDSSYNKYISQKREESESSENELLSDNDSHVDTENDDDDEDEVFERKNKD
ncbi:hypothetical protein H4219_005896 [Mycoemilia scoparia]|uniref:Uncharacterized protein n=1 Tax=Mycoemilia scoparia TaxID=417184 RepID=A0A9W7ZM56_9FUNG|nr:hypothetical protein H4219_005896 [Mycoemilia scoparia]